MPSRSTTLMLYCMASSNLIVRFGFRSSAAFSTLSERVASKLKDPSLVGDGGVAGETFNVIDPGASAQQVEDGSSISARVKRMGRDDAKTVSPASFPGLWCIDVFCRVRP